MLGNSITARNTAKEVALSNNFELYTFPFLASRYFKEDTIFSEEEQLWETSPFEWIAWINNADVIITDSFHMTAFSIMFHKNFYVVEKDGKEKAQNNRIINLLGMVGLENRFLMNGISPDNISITSDNDINWDNIDEILSEERRKSITLVDKIMVSIFPELEGNLDDEK